MAKTWTVATWKYEVRTQNTQPVPYNLKRKHGKKREVDVTEAKFQWAISSDLYPHLGHH